MQPGPPIPGAPPEAPKGPGPPPPRGLSWALQGPQEGKALEEAEVCVSLLGDLVSSETTGGSEDPPSALTISPTNRGHGSSDWALHARQGMVTPLAAHSMLVLAWAGSFLHPPFLCGAPERGTEQWKCQD